ncbi:hypothetical protein E5288_WYG014647 [Bos mutus]|uniref:Uncharacterized protein n=1 Tax=Bos mutus TaxID=72004 RepID=A0A6B0R2N9_9CETA|nr:hypothetical protein [Bos mutus]
MQVDPIREHLSPPDSELTQCQRGEMAKFLYGSIKNFLNLDRITFGESGAMYFPVSTYYRHLHEGWSPERGPDRAAITLRENEMSIALFNKNTKDPMTSGRACLPICTMVVINNVLCPIIKIPPVDSHWRSFHPQAMLLAEDIRGTVGEVPGAA